MNPELDIGQVEGGFTMGLGYFLQEELQYDSQTGEMLTAGTWVGYLDASEDIYWFKVSVWFVQDNFIATHRYRHKVLSLPP